MILSNILFSLHTILRYENTAMLMGSKQERKTRQNIPRPTLKTNQRKQTNHPINGHNLRFPH